MAKTERELAFLRDLDINETWTRRFTDLIDKNVDLKDAANILYINAGTGDHCIAVSEKADDGTAIFASCENPELLNIARDKGAAVRADIVFSEIEFEDDSFDVVIADGAFTEPDLIEDLIEEAARTARSGGRVAVVVPSAGSYGEIFSLVWEVLFNEGLGEHGAVAEQIVADIPTTTKLEEFAAKNELTDIKTEYTTEIFEYENGKEFVGSPLVSDFLLPAWLETLDENDKERVVEKLAQLIDAEDGELSFRFSVKVALLTGKKA